MPHIMLAYADPTRKRIDAYGSPDIPLGLEGMASIQDLDLERIVKAPRFGG